MPKALAQTLRIYLSSFFIITVLFLAIANLNIYFSPSQPQTQVMGVAVDLVAEKEFWQGLVSENPTYRDGFVELAKIECELKEVVACQNDLEKARALDPNYRNYPSFSEVGAAVVSSPSAGF